MSRKNCTYTIHILFIIGTKKSTDIVLECQIFKLHFIFPYHCSKFHFDRSDHVSFESSQITVSQTVYTDLIVQLVKITPPPSVVWSSSASGYAFTYSMI